MNNKITKFISILFLFTSILTAQEKEVKQDTLSSKSNSIKSIDGVTASGNKIDFKNETGNAIITITDEGSNVGSILLPSGSAPGTTTNKLYNESGTLKFNGAAIGSGSGSIGINDLTDAKWVGGSLFIGELAGANDDAQDNGNTAVGYNAMNSNTSGYDNTAIGYSSLASNTTGNKNTAIGLGSLNSNTTGIYNTAIGGSSLSNNIDGDNNTANGFQSLISNLSGGYNVAFGSYALTKNTTGDRNTSTGFQALHSNTIGANNVGIGTGANYFNQEGSNNTMIGYQAGKGSAFHNKSGNVFIGYQAGYNETGDNKLYINNDNSSFPLIYGDFSTNILTINGSLISGSGSTANGGNSVALGTNCAASGTQSIAFGSGAIAYGEAAIAGGIDATANIQAVSLGTQTKANAANSVALGNYVETTGTGSLIIGDNSVSTVLSSSDANTFTARFSGGYKFFTNSASPFVGAKLDAGANSWSVISDSTKKENFKLVNGEEILSKISKFKLTSWNYKTQDPTKFRHYGPMAQDFYTAFGNDGIGSIGNDTTIASSDFAGINFIAVQALVKRNKHQEASIKILESRIEKLEEKNKKLVSAMNEMDDLKAVLETLLKQQPKIKFSSK